MAPVNKQLSPTSALAVFVWNGQQWTPWDGGGSSMLPNNPPSVLEGIGLYYFNTADNSWAPWDGTLPSGGGGGVAGVTQIVAGTDISISPAGGTGVVTVNAVIPPVVVVDDFAELFMLMGA